MSRFDELDVIIRRRGDKAYASIPQLALYAHGNDVTTALSRLEEKKNLLINELTEAGELETFDISPHPHKERALESGGIIRFILKTVIIVAILGVGGYALTTAAHRAALNATANITTETRKLAREIHGQINAVQTQFTKSMSGREFWTKVEEGLDRLADPKSDLPPEKKEEAISRYPSGRNTLEALHRRS